MFQINNVGFKKLLTMICWGCLSCATVNAQDAPPVPVPVKVEEVRATDNQSTAEITGTIYSRNQVLLSAGVAGRLAWVVEPGSYLKAGDLVAQIELLPLQLQQAEKQAQYKRSKINLQYLQRELERQQELRQKNSSSQYQLEQTQSQVDLALSDLEIAELQLQQSSDQLMRATVVAPFDGVVIERSRRAGIDVARSDAIVELLDTENLEVRLFVPVKYLAFTKIGNKLSLSSRSDDGSLLTLETIATTIIPTADPRSQTFEMRVTLPKEAQQYWTTGQMINVSLPIESIRSSVTVHRDALILRRDGTYVVKIDDKNKSHRLKVVVGKGEGEWVSIEGDLMPGDRVAVRGAERLVEGQEVVVQVQSAES